MKTKHKTKQTSKKTSLALSAVLLLAPVDSAHAGSTISGKEPSVNDSATKQAEPSLFDKIWSLATLYKNDSNSFIQEFKLRGRYHGQYHWLDSDQGSNDGWEDRRTRLGIEGKLFNKQVGFRAEFQSADEFDPFYQQLTDVYLKWNPSAALNLTVGKQKPQIGAYDWLPSTNPQPTFERSQIFNQLRVERAPGVVIDGKIDHWTYQAGIYSNRVDHEFGQFDGGVSFTAGIGYDLKDLLNTEKADLRFDYLHSEIDPNDTLMNRYSDIFSTTLWLKKDRWGLVTEAFAGTGGSGNDGDVVGFFILPTYDLIPMKLQLVGRYTFSVGDGADSVIAQPRYERAAPELTGGGRGDQYQAGYVGLQYFIHGDKLKLLGGIEYAKLNGGGNGGDYDGWTALTGIRFSF